MIPATSLCISGDTEKSNFSFTIEYAQRLFGWLFFGCFCLLYYIYGIDSFCTDVKSTYNTKQDTINVPVPCITNENFDLDYPPMHVPLRRKLYSYASDVSQKFVEEGPSRATADCSPRRSSCR